MKPSTFLLLLVFVPATIALGQGSGTVNDRQRLNGKWMFDAAKSDSLEERYKGDSLEIAYTDPELTIVATRTRDNETKSATINLFTDNRGEKNRPYPFNQDLQIESKTLWVKNTLVRSYVIKIYQSGKVVGTNTVRETYSLSEGGDSLTVIDESRSKISTDSPYGKLNTDDKGKSKRVYKRMK